MLAGSAPRRPRPGRAVQIIHQNTFAVTPCTPLADIIRRGEDEHEPACLVEGLRRVAHREAEQRFHKVVARKG